MIGRRGLLTLGGGLLLGGCDALAGNDKLKAIVGAGEDASRRWQRLIGRDALAREYGAADISPVFKVNGTRAPTDPAYRALADRGFADWRLRIDGRVARPLALSLPELHRLPQRTQITRHDCVEGWSAIGQWTGVPLGLILRAAGLHADARYLVFHCADDYGGVPGARYYESVDLVDAFHPQTILAHALNGAPLSVGHGAPLRLRVERQLGYKHAKYLMRIEAVTTLAGIGRGKGGFWEDRGYEWYAGI